MSSSPHAVAVQAGEVRLQTYDYGSRAPSDAPTMVVVHGMQDFALALQPFCEAFADSHRVIAYDQRGHGDSEHAGNYTLPHLLADLHAVLHHYQCERPVLVGHSLGSVVVSHYAAIFDDVPSALVSIDGLGAPMRESDVPLEDRRWRLQNGIAALLAPAVHGRPMHDLDDAAGLFSRFHPGIDPDLARHLVELGTTAHPHGGLQWKWDPAVLSIGLQSSQALSEERWQWVTCPTLLITGAQSAEFFVRMRGLDPTLASSAPEEIERRAKLFPNANWVVIEEAGHMVHYDAPERLVSIVKEWL